MTRPTPTPTTPASAPPTLTVTVTQEDIDNGLLPLIPMSASPRVARVMQLISFAAALGVGL